MARFLDLASGEPAVYSIGIADLKDAVAKGIADFNAMPTPRRVPRHHLSPFSGSFCFRLSFGYDVLPLVYPMLGRVHSARTVCGRRSL